MPEALAPPPGNPRFPLVDGLRGLATLSVVIFHVALQTGATRGGGWHDWIAFLTFGPALFFMFSGFLLYRPFVAARFLGTPAPTVRSFARKRALRVIPAYWVALTLMAIYPGVQGAVLGEDFWIYYGMVHIYFSDAVVGGLGVSWTLCTELAFYICLPLVALLGAATSSRLGPRVARRIEIAALLCLIPLAYLWSRHWVGAPGFSALDFGRYLSLPANAGAFGLGMVVAILSVQLPGERSIRARIPAWPVFSLACLGAAFAAYQLGMVWRPGLAEGAIINQLIGIMLLIPAVFALPTDRGLERVLGTRVFAWLGLVAYGVYLYHPRIIEKLHESGIGAADGPGFLVLLGVAMPISIALGALSYYALERPVLRHKYRRRKAHAPAVLAPQPQTAQPTAGP